MEEEIKKELIKLNFRVGSMGIFYWISAIKYVRENPTKWTMAEIYTMLAEKYGTTYVNAERCMRFARNTADKNIQEKYNYAGKITNSVYLKLIKLEML